MEMRNRGARGGRKREGEGEERAGVAPSSLPWSCRLSHHGSSLVVAAGFFVSAIADKKRKRESQRERRGGGPLSRAVTITPCCRSYGDRHCCWNRELRRKGEQR
ncbi:hypothetical protein AHAS_Ahas15G0229500 [Arachis hypogaea]